MIGKDVSAENISVKVPLQESQTHDGSLGLAQTPSLTRTHSVEGPPPAS